MWDNDFSPYDLLIETHSNTLKLNLNQQELNRNQQVLEHSDMEIAKMLNQQSETIKQILQQNGQLNDMIKRTRIELERLNTEITVLKQQKTQ
jgi:succinate dehydrogenase flavin-adding protein (antitoxin of CptAB toxin-antitoxin module)